MTTSIGGAVRIGAVTYLNSKPLIEGLAELLPDAELSLDYPSRLADDLEAGQLDVALVPSIEVLRHPELRNRFRRLRGHARPRDERQAV